MREDDIKALIAKLPGNFMGTAATTAIDPRAYEAWRASALGAVTEALEQRLILELMGELSAIRVLDVGCGDGMLACAAAARGAQVIGVDPDPTMLAAARARAEVASVKVDFMDGRIERLPFADASFDLVAAVTVLCFVVDAGGAVREIARVLRPGGRLILGDLGKWSSWAAVRRIRGWLGAPPWNAARFRTASELRALARQAGLFLAATRGAIFYPPVGVFAQALAPFDPGLGRITTFGAAFIVLKAIKLPDVEEHKA